MNDDIPGVIHDGTHGGITGNHPYARPFEFLVAPATSNELNTARLRLIPIACWKLDDVRFAFDSSFVTPDAKAELELLVELRAQKSQKDPGSGDALYPPLSVFGHTDPVGPAVAPDEYNKSLSGRRATAVYALLLSHTDPDTAVGLWRTIASQENWGSDQKQMMQANVPAGTSDSNLYKAYMESLCPSDLKLTNADFLGQGAGNGKGDYQGCSSFNPTILFSQSLEDQYDEAERNQDQDGIRARNAANALNRRVVVLLFKVGSKIDPAKWPCPRATEGMSGCIKRFWSDGQQRRKELLPDRNRKFADTHDTWACRFYQRLADASPCEGNRYLVKIRLLDAFSQPIPNAPYQIGLPGGTRKGQADKHGWLQEIVSKVPEQAHLVWGYADNIQPEPKDVGSAPPIALDSMYQMDVRLNVSAGTEGSDGSDPVLTAKLSNLGYSCGKNLTDNVKAFQLDHRRPEGQTGNPADIQDVVARWNDIGDAQGVPIMRSITLYGRLPDDETTPV